jgi:dihydrodipicolinate synthase/N-acetylneuraminate lyase
MSTENSPSLRNRLLSGMVIPAMPLALNPDRTWSQIHQRALIRYYLESGAGGLAVGVHTTQFEIRAPEHDLFEGVLEFSAATVAMEGARPGNAPFTLIAGVCGETTQACREAELARTLGYEAALLSLSALRGASDDALLEHCQTIAKILPVIGFYLQPTIGGRTYGYRFWRQFSEIENVVAIKIAPFNRYATLDVVRAVAASGRTDIALYTGNDDNIIHDLITPFLFGDRSLRIAGGLLGQWAVGTQRAVTLLDSIQRDDASATEWAKRNAQLTDFNSAIFDAANQFAGCIAGINEMLRREGLLPSAACLDAAEVLSSGQSEELDRVSAAYPEWQDREFIQKNLERWLKD